MAGVSTAIAVTGSTGTIAVSTARTAAPVATATVMLLDSTDVAVAWAETDSAGRFVLRAPHTGVYRVSAGRMAYSESLSEELPLPYGGFHSWSEDGNKIAYNRIFREFRTWKYYEGGMADEVWIHDFTTKETKKVTDNPAQDIIPMWAGPGSSGAQG